MYGEWLTFKVKLVLVISRNIKKLKGNNSEIWWIYISTKWWICQVVG